MNNAVDEPKIENEAKAKSCCSSGSCPCDQMAKRIEHGVDETKAAAAAKLEEGKIVAERLLANVKRGAGDGILAMARKIQDHPFETVGLALAAGATLALLLPHTNKE